MRPALQTTPLRNLTLRSLAALVGDRRSLKTLWKLVARNAKVKGLSGDFKSFSKAFLNEPAPVMGLQPETHEFLLPSPGGHDFLGVPSDWK
jgi:hypothetical protein